jgi:acyl-CoA reductase-like NAD-dependent aldehyde dehydrogenase
MEKVKTGIKESKPALNGSNGNGHTASERLSIRKTYKMYIDGKFPRSESGRSIKFKDAGGNLLADVCRGSKKDFRDAVLAARKAQEGWAKRSAFNRSQILYRIAETLEGRSEQFIATLVKQGARLPDARRETALAIDRIVYFAGWCDKFQQVFSSVNPVESSHFNFSFPEPTGVVSIIAPDEPGLLGLVSAICPVIAGGNAVIVLASEKFPLTAIEFAETIHASDLPGGVINLMTGYASELATPFSSHMDINACIYCGKDLDILKSIQVNAAMNVKRVLHYDDSALTDGDGADPYRIMDVQEIKTTWHPVGV